MAFTLSKKVKSFVDSCDYDIKEGNLDVLMYRVNQFNRKYGNLAQDVMLGLFKKICVENNPMLKWIINNMDEKAMRYAFGEWIMEEIMEEGEDDDDDEFEEDEEFEHDELWRLPKEKQFFDILKKYGITEYWCSKEFDLSEDFPVGSVLLPTDEGAPAVEISDLYTKMVEYTQEYCSVGVFIRAGDSEIFNAATKNMERREVS